MADDFDVEDLLEAPFRKGDEASNRSQEGLNADKENRRGSGSGSGKKKKRSRSRERSRSRDRRSRSRERRRSRSRGRERKRSRSRGRDKGHSSHHRHHGASSRHRSRERRSRSRERERKSRSPAFPIPPPAPPRRDAPPVRHRRSFSKSPIRVRAEDLSPEERDARTIFCMQLSQRVRSRDLEEFFSSVGKVKDVRLIMDNKTRRSKGIAYVEFAAVESVALALGLNNQKLLGVPIIVQPTQAEKNRAAATVSIISKGMIGPMRLYVGSLHFNITEEMLRGIFEPFGKIDHIELTRDLETGRSKGYGFITFHDAEDAKKALEQLNGFELAGRPMKVGHVTERAELMQGPSFLDSDELDRTGIDLGATGRLQLMAKLAEGTGFQLPQAAVTALQMTPGGLPGSLNAAAPPIATQCFMLANMFDSAMKDNNPLWDEEIRNDVIEECRNHGGALHVFVDKSSQQGNVYVKCPTIAAAVASVNALHGRWFAGRVITAAYVPVMNYHSLFPDAATALTSL